MFGNQGGLGKALHGSIIVFTRGTITVNGIEISKEEQQRLKEDSARKLLAVFTARQKERERLLERKSVEESKKKVEPKKAPSVKKSQTKI